MDVVLHDRPHDGVMLLRLNRPDKLNALNLELRRVLARYLEDASGDKSVRAIVIVGNERAFAAGADLAELVDLNPGDARFEEMRVVWDALAACPKPIVAGVRGLALGGGFELALGCDLIIAGEKARFGLPEAQVGIIPGAGGLPRLARLVGRQQAMFWLLTGGMIDAATALRRGIAAHVVADDVAEALAIEFAVKAATLSPDVMTTLKQGLRLNDNSFLDDALATERPMFEGLFGKPHQRDGMAKVLSRSQDKPRKVL